MLYPTFYYDVLYNLTYKVGNSVYDTQSYFAGDSILPPANPTITGQAFNGWTNLPSTMPANDVEVSASLTPIDYTLSYYVDSSLWNSDTYHYGDAITARSVPEKHLYTSLGWSPSVPATMPANDLSVSAVYEANSLSSQYVFDSLDELPKFREKLYNDTTEATRKGNLLNVVASPYSEAYLDENEQEINVYPVYVVTPSAAQVKSGYYLRQMPVPDPIYLKIENSYFELTFEKKRENGIIYTVAEEAATETPAYYYEVSSTDVIYGDKFGVLYEMLVPNSENFANLTGNQLTIASHSYTRTSSIINDKVVFEHNYTFDSDFIESWEIDTNLNELEEAQIHRIFFISGQAEVEVPADSSLFLHIFYPFGTEIDWTDLLSKYKASGLDATDLTQYKITGFLGTTPKMGKENLIVEINYDKILPDDFIVLTYIADDEIYSVYPATPNSSVVPKPEQNPVKQGYDFVAWDPSISTVPAVDTSLYATWAEAQDSSTVDPSTDSSVEPRYTAAYYLDDVLYHTVSLHEGDEFEVLPDVVRTGYVFSGWKMHDESAIPSAMPAADISLDATMEERQPSLHTLTYKLDDTTYKAYQVDYGWPLTEDPIVIRQGKLFSGWHWPDNTKPLTMPDEDVTVDGSLSNDPDYGIDLPDDPTESSHVLTYYYNSSVYGTQTYAFDASIVPLAAPASPGEDYTWSGWLGIPETMPAHDVTTLGRYLKPDDSSDSSSGGSTKAYMVRYVTKPGGARDDTQTVVVKTVDVSQGTVHTVDCSLNLDEGIIFDGWYLDSSIVESFVMPRNDVRLTGYLYDENNIDTSIAGYHKVAWYVHYTESDAWKLHKVQQYHEGDTIVEPETPVAPEHLELDFDKWGDYPETMPDHDVSVYGTFKYREKSFKVYYWLRDGGDLTGVTTRLHYETTCQWGVRHTLIPLIETPEGKKLDGWYWHRFDIYDQSNPYSAKRYGEDFIMPYKDVNIYCDIWDADADVAIPGYYRINWMLQYSEVSRQSTNTALFKREFLRENDSIIDPSINPTYPVESAGMIFDYWEEHPETMPAANIEIWGHFKYNHLAHNIVYKYVDVATNQEVTFDTSTCVGGQQYSFATAKPADVSGYIFDGWYFKRQQVFGFEQGVYHAGPTRLGYSYCKDVSTITMPDNDVYVWGEYLDDDTQWDVPGYHKVIYTRRLPKGATAQNPETEIMMQWKTERFKEGDTITYATAPVINHYTATAWHLEDATQTLPTVMGTEDIYVFCEYNYAFNTHNVIYKYGFTPDAVDSSVYRTVECTEGSTYTFITEKPAAPEGYLIEGWYFPRQQVFGFETGAHYAGNHIGCSYTADVPQIRMPDNDVLVYCKYVQNSGQDLPGYYKLKYIVTYPPGATSQNPEIWWTSTFKTEQYQQGDTITYATGPTVGHYTFTGWHLEDTTQTLPTTMGSEDITVYGTFTYAANTHNVTYKYGFTPDAADSSVYRTVQVQEGSQYSWITDKPAPPDGYLIEGWYFKRQQVFGFQPGSYSAGTHVGCSYCVDVPTITMPDNDVEAYCQYVADSGQDLPGYYKLSYYMYCPPGSDAYHPETWYTKLLKTEQYEAGATITYATAPEIAHYNFSGWHLEDGSSVLPMVMPSNDLVVKGEYSYTPNVHNVIYQYGTSPDGQDASIFRTVQVTEGSTYSWITDKPAAPEGYIRDGWYFKRQEVFGFETGTHYAGTHLGCSYCTDVPQIVMPDKDIHAYLQFVESGGPNPIAGYRKVYWLIRYTDTMYWMNYLTEDYEVGQTIVRPTDPSPYPTASGQLVFDHWSAYPTTMPDNDLNIYGYFRAQGNQYAVTYNIVTVPESGPRQYESYVVYWEAGTAFVADPRPPVKTGYYWDGWQGVPQTMPNHDVIITGYYYPGDEEDPQPPEPPTPVTYTLSYYEEDNTTLVGTQTYAEGDTIVPLSHPDVIGYRNNGWQTLPINMKMPASNLRVHKSYTKIPTVVYYADDSIYAVQTYEIGDRVAMPADNDPQKTGYRFMGWSPNLYDTLIVDDSTLTTHAVFEKLYKITYIIED